MSLKISLAHLNGTGFIAQVEDPDDDQITVAEDRGGDSTEKEVCLEAARALREAARRFELLADEPRPCRLETHDRINQSNLPGGEQ